MRVSYTRFSRKFEEERWLERTEIKHLVSTDHEVPPYAIFSILLVTSSLLE
jgi:hypothetical protein